mgnify:CR=1 FL=1
MSDGQGVRLVVKIGQEVLDAAARLAAELGRLEQEAGVNRPGLARMAARAGGFVALAMAAPGSLAREALQAWADREQWLVECQVLGGSRADLEQHEEVVKALALTSPVFSNKDVWRAGWRLARYRLAAGWSVIPRRGPGRYEWADALFREAYVEGAVTAISSMCAMGLKDRDSQFRYLNRLLPAWRAEAWRLWAERDKQGRRPASPEGG